MKKSELLMQGIAMLVLGLSTSAFAVTSVTLTPASFARLDGTTVQTSGDRLTWVYGGYRICAEYDLHPYKAVTLFRATLNFHRGPLWGMGYSAGLARIESDLSITNGDYNRTALETIQSGALNSGDYSLDVTSCVKAALATSSTTQGIQFRWSDTGSDGYLGYELNGNIVTLTLEFMEATILTPHSFARLDGTTVQTSGDRLRWVYGNYRICTEFDIHGLQGTQQLVKATLTFDHYPLWYIDNSANVEMIASDLNITNDDYNRSALYPAASGLSNSGSYAIDVTNLVRVALIDAGTTQGIQFRWRDNGYEGYLGYNMLDFSPARLTLEFLPIDRGHAILMGRGLQIQSLIQPDWAQVNTFNLTNWNYSAFTTICDWYPYNTQYLPSSFGFPWSRWLVAWCGLEANEEPRIYDLISLQIGDEQDLRNTTIRADVASNVNAIRNIYPSAIIHTDQKKDYMLYDVVGNYMLQAQPDMLMFNAYPFNGEVDGSSPTGMYVLMQKYRALGLAGNDGTFACPIPFAHYTQAVTQSGHTPSESEIRLNQFAGWAFGYTFACAFAWTDVNDGSQSILFSGSNDNNPTSSFTHMQETNLQSRRLGPAFVRLINQDLRMKMGQHRDYYWVIWPIWQDYDVVNNSHPTDVLVWNGSPVDTYLQSNMTVTNLGSCNYGLRGDVIVGHFAPLHESLDGPYYSNQLYFMIVNGLTDGGGSANDCRQQIRLNFDFGSSGITNLQRMRRSDGQVEVVPLVHDGGSLYHLDLELPGGTGDLLKYNTGAPFVGAN